MVGVTKVLGTFQGSFVTNSLSNSIAGSMHQPIRENPPVLPRKGLEFLKKRLTATVLVPDSIEVEPWMKEHNSIHDEEFMAPLPVIKENSTKIEVVGQRCLPVYPFFRDHQRSPQESILNKTPGFISATTRLKLSWSARLRPLTSSTSTAVCILLTSGARYSLRSETPPPGRQHLRHRVPINRSTCSPGGGAPP